MKILYKVVMEPNVIVEKVIKDVDYITIGKRSFSYRLKGKSKFIFSVRYDGVQHIRVLEDEDESKGFGD